MKNLFYENGEKPLIFAFFMKVYLVVTNLKTTKIWNKHIT
jgi:hypothetical protein